MGRFFLAAVTLSALALSGAESADELAGRGIRALKDSLKNQPSVVEAARCFAKAAALYDAAGNSDKAVEMGSYLYWCRKKMRLEDIEALGKPEDKAAVTSLEKIEALKVPETDAGVWMKRAEKFAQEHPDEHFLAAVRFFEVAERFKGTESSFAAQDRSLKEQQLSFSERPKPAAPLPIPQPGADKFPVPDAATIKAADAKIHAVFQDEFAKSDPRDKLVLARKLLQQAKENPDQPEIKFTQLRDARDLASGAGDLEVADAAIDQLYVAFRVDPGQLRLEYFQKIAPLLAPADTRKLLAHSLQAVDEAVAGDFFDSALKLENFADATARKLQDPSAIAEVQAKLKAVRELQTEFGRTKSARDTLLAKPSDPDANFALGRFYGFVKGDWKKALPYLARGKPGPARDAAEKELEAKAGGDDVAAGDAWWIVAEKETGRFADNGRKHAAEFYKRALPSLAGLARTTAEKRIDDATDLIFVGDLTPKLKKATADIIAVNREPYGREVLAGDRPCTQFIFAHAPSKLVYDLPKRVTLFTATGILPQGDAKVEGAWKYRVLLDGRKAYESGELRLAPNKEITISVPIPPGARELTLEIDDLGSPPYKHSIWGYPMLHR